ncbi:MAG: dicarboxylate/amino acid:cation symporter [Candidatus Marinamargulisbacteria bacterium]
MKRLQLTIILSVVLGLLAGLLADEYVATYQWLGMAFIALLKYIVVPLVFASLISGVISLGNVSSLQKMGVKTIGYFILTTILASITGIVLAVVFSPGKGFILPPGMVPSGISAMTFKQLVAHIIPTHFLGFISGQNMLFLIFLSLLIGILILLFGRKSAFPIDELFEGFNEFMIIITQWVISFSPIGIFGLMAHLVATTGGAGIVSLAKYMAVVGAGLAIHALVVIPLIMKATTKWSPWEIAKNMLSSLITGFSTASSAATLPILMEDSRQKLKVPNKVASFVLPLGITINMDGTALFQSVAVIFMAQIYGMSLSITSLGVIIFLTVVSSISAAAVPSAGVITLTMILTALGIPIEGLVIILGIDRLLDMLRTTVNLWGNTVAGLVITKWMKGDAYDD